jgi:hypothetical protein
MRNLFNRSMALVGILLSSNILAFAVPNSVSVRDTSGSSQTNRPFTISRVFAKGEIPHFAQAVVNGTAVMTQCDVKTRWADGSVQHALVSFLASVGANATITVGFQDQPTGNNSGALDKAGMLAANWGAQIEVTNGTTLVANARQIVTDWGGTSSDARVTYWLQGPVCTQIILEDRSTTLAYDLGWDTHKPLHPIFVVTFYPGSTAGAKVEMILENMWTTKLEDQTYSLVLKTGNPLGSPVYSKSSYTHIAKSRWRKVFWSGPQPGSVNSDYNLAYMISTQAVPNWDLSKTVPSGTISGDVSNFNKSDQGPTSVAAANDLGSTVGGVWQAGHGLWTQYIPQTGGRPEIGVFPAWYVRYLYTFDPNMYNMFIGQAAVSGYLPGHLRESITGRYFDSARTVDAFGRPLSLDARPTIYAPDFSRVDLTASGDLIKPVGTVTTGGWTDDIAHEPDWSYLPYLITGDWYFLEELYFHASSLLGFPAPGFGNYSRGNSWGYFPFAIQTRGQAWGLRDVAHAAFIAPDGTPEKAYFTEKLNNNIAVEEGNQNVLAGNYTPADPTCSGYTMGPAANKWCYGRMTIGQNLPNPLHFLNYGDYGVCSPPDPRLVPASDPYACATADSQWMYGYKYNVVGHIQELGFGIAPLNQVQFLNLLHMIADPAFNPWLVGEYRVPAQRNSPKGYFQNWGAVLNGYSTTYKDACGNTFNLRTVTMWTINLCGGGDSDTVNPGYPHIEKGAASYLAGLGINDGALSGTSAWNWMVRNVGYQNAVGQNPQYVILPRTLSSTPPASQCDLNSDGVVDALDVQISINKTLGLSACGSGDLTGSGTCTVVSTQRVINAALGSACRLGP